MRPREQALLDEGDCRRALEGVDRLRASWLPQGRDPLHPYFHVLPTALYLRQGQSSRYRAEGDRAREALLHEFSWLYQRLCEALSVECGEPVRLSESASLPGFHIYGLPMPQGGSVHVDRPEVGFEWPDRERYDFDSFLSATLALRVPAAGAGLRLWPEGPEASSIEIEYRVGCLYVLRERVLHQIAPRPAMLAGDRRITLQAHGARLRGGGWELYF